VDFPFHVYADLLFFVLIAALMEAALCDDHPCSDIESAAGGSDATTS